MKRIQNSGFYWKKACRQVKQVFEGRFSWIRNDNQINTILGG
jgi:hypothetical protein